jgi:hypothetical protein
MPKVLVKESHLTHNGIAYFRGGAEQVELGSIGEKRTSIAKTNYLEVKDTIAPSKIKDSISTVIEIDTTRLSKDDFGGKITAIIPRAGLPTLTTLAADTALSQIKSQELKLVKLSVLNHDMMKAVNDLPEMLKHLAQWGPKARIAHQIFVVMDATLSSKFDNRSNLSFSVGNKGIDVTVGGGTGASGSTTVRMAPGSCFAYLLARIEWNSKRTEIVDLNDDQWGLG